MEEKPKEIEDASLLSTDLSDLKINKQTIDLLVANVIPTTKYFESRFDHMQYQISEIKTNLSEFKKDVDKRFDAMQGEMDKRFDAMQNDMDKRFDAVDRRFVAMQGEMDKRFDAMQADMDKRFDAVDRRFDKVLESIERLGDKIDKRDERQRNFTLQMFSIAISISILGVLGVFLKSFGII